MQEQSLKTGTEMVALSRQSAFCAVETHSDLLRQREAFQRIDRSLGEAVDNIGTGQRIATRMASYFGSWVHWSTGVVATQDSKEPQRAPVTSVLPLPPTQTQVASQSLWYKGLSRESANFMEQSDRQLDQLSSNLQAVRFANLAIHDELEYQKPVLQSLVDKTQNANADLQQAIKTVDSINK